MPMIVNLTLSMVTVEPTFRRLDFAYPESTTATSESESAEVKEWPEVIVAGTQRAERGVPGVHAVDGEAVRLRRGAAGRPKFFGERDRRVGEREPAGRRRHVASLATSATFDALIGPVRRDHVVDRLPAAFSHLPLLQISAPPGPPGSCSPLRRSLLPVLGGPGAAPVTVTSVPTPYSALARRTGPSSPRLTRRPR